jgi:alpha-1,2-mannosyltransferase
VYLWSRDRRGAAGVCLGLAAALKLTALIFVAYFAWKRQWRMAAWSLAAAVLFSLTPAIWMGWHPYVDHMHIWSSTLADAVRQPDPRVGVLGLESVQNISLRPALARFLMHVPAGADGQGRFVHPLNVDVLTLAPAVAGAIVRLVFVALVGAAMWATRKPLAGPGDARAVWECAGVAVLGLLLSPITWRSHAVAVLPACYLVLRRAAAGERISASARAGIALLIVTSLILSRGVAGQTVNGLVHAHYLFTWTFLVLMCSMWRAASLTRVRREGEM